MVQYQNNNIFIIKVTIHGKFAFQISPEGLAPEPKYYVQLIMMEEI